MHPHRNSPMLAMPVCAMNTNVTVINMHTPTHTHTHIYTFTILQRSKLTIFVTSAANIHHVCTRVTRYNETKMTKSK